MWMKYVYTGEILQWKEFDYDIKKNCIFIIILTGLSLILGQTAQSSRTLMCR